MIALKHSPRESDAAILSQHTIPKGRQVQPRLGVGQSTYRTVVLIAGLFPVKSRPYSVSCFFDRMALQIIFPYIRWLQSSIPGKQLTILVRGIRPTKIDTICNNMICYYKSYLYSTILYIFILPCYPFAGTEIYSSLFRKGRSRRLFLSQLRCYIFLCSQCRLCSVRNGRYNLPNGFPPHVARRKYALHSSPRCLLYTSRCV